MMYTVRWLIVIAIGVALGYITPSNILAAPVRQTDIPLEVRVMVVQTEAIVGAPMTWRIILTPQRQQQIDAIELRPGDERTWMWLDGPQSIEILTDTVVLNVSAIPLVRGELTPIVEAHYTVGNKTYHQLDIVDDNAVQVEAMAARIEADVVPLDGTARQESPLRVELTIRNNSPFTLTDVQVGGNGVDLLWGTPIKLGDMPPGEIRHPLTPTVVGQHPRPQLTVGYVWTDATGASHHRILSLGGQTVPLEPSLLGRIPNEAFGILLGVIAGILTTLFTGLVRGWVSRLLQKGVNRRQVHGLLPLLTLQSEHAADNGVAVVLEPLETIFKEEGLFRILQEDKLIENARDLWKTAERHNSGLNRPGGTQRSDELRKSARALSKKLDKIQGNGK